MTFWLSAEGRITRSQFWGGMLGLFILGFFVLLLSTYLAVHQGKLGEWLGFALLLGWLCPVTVLVTKRLRDRGRHSIPLWLIAYLSPILVINLAQILRLGFETELYGSFVITRATSGGSILVTAGLLIHLMAFVDLGLMKGEADA